MTLDEIDATVSLMKAAGRRNVPVPLSEWREYMVELHMLEGRKIKVGKGGVKNGKFKRADTAPAVVKAGRRHKADRVERRLRANRVKA